MQNMDKKETRNSREKIFIIVLLVLAGVRVFIFNAAFPINNNVDEFRHFDTVLKYARGYVPAKGVEKLDRESIEFLALYQSEEYWSEGPSVNKEVPLWKYPNIRKAQKFQDFIDSQVNTTSNMEAGSFPVYYVLAGLWWDIGKLIKLNEGDMIFSIKFLNIPIFLGLVWVSYLIGKTFFPDNNFQQKGLPIMVAFFPQDAFYSISNDTITPLLFSLSFFMLLKILFEDKSLSFYFFTAIVISLTLLTKVSNITMLALLGMIVVLKLRQIINQKQFKENIFKLVILIGVSTIPLGLWMIRNYIVLGDIAGSAAKAEYWGWKAKPFGQIWNHPIFTFDGAMIFFGDLIKTFWRGEFIWHLKRICSKGFDLFYVISTAIFMAVSLILLFRNKNKQERMVFGVSFILIAVSVMMLAGLSILYDFSKCVHPSLQYPYVNAGRLILGTLVPFLVIYLNGFEKILMTLKIKLNPLIFVVIIAVGITISEIVLSLNVFSSPYNWFHLQL